VSASVGVLRLLAADEQIALLVRQVDGLRAGTGTTVDVDIASGDVHEAVVLGRRNGAGEPLGFVAHSESAAFEAIAAGADEACVADGLDLPRFIAFLDRLELRARNRRETENRQASAAHAEKLAALGTVVAGVAHEINNPLGVIVLVNDLIRSGLEPLIAAQEEIFRLARRRTGVAPDEIVRLADMAQTGGAPSELRTALDDADAALRTITDVVKDLRIFARSENEERVEPVYLPDLLDNVLRIVGPQITAVAALERDYATDVPVLLLPRSRLTQVFTNLLVNAAHAAADVVRPMHRVRISIRSDAETVAISVSDTGSGIPADIIERIFDPFFTTKRGEGATGGTGLGLSISRSILRGLGGDLIAESVHGAGATFIAMVPVEGHRFVRSARAEVSESSPPSSGRSSVLVVEDEEGLLRAMANALRRRFRVLLAADGQEAIDLLASGSEPDAILCDMGMPLIDGPRLYEWLLHNRPRLARRVAFMSANASSESAIAFAKREGRPLVEKPISRDKLIALVDGMLSGTIHLSAR
jgi:signal transduction histidine kinase